MIERLREVGVDVVVKGRNVEVPEHFRVHVADKLSRVERYDNKIIEVDVELLHERNPRQSDSCQRIEITCVSRGPVVRAEACAPDFYAALDKALEKLESRLRRLADRRRVHHSRHASGPAVSPVALSLVAPIQSGPSDPAPLRSFVGAPMDGAAVDGVSVRGASVQGPSVQGAAVQGAAVEGVALAGNGAGPVDGARPAESAVAVALRAAEEADDQPWHVARTKEHPASPMTVEDALHHMELVGHDFYLFLDKESGRASVVYRRKGYDYGVISLAAA